MHDVLLLAVTRIWP